MLHTEVYRTLEERHGYGIALVGLSGVPREPGGMTGEGGSMLSMVTRARCAKGGHGVLLECGSLTIVVVTLTIMAVTGASVCATRR